MSHLMSSMENLQGYEKIEKVGVGASVLFHIQPGRQRQGRETFPALVFSQHPDDGTLDLLVFFEPEDVIWERRVSPYSETMPGRCWSPITDQPGAGERDSESMEAIRSGLADIKAKIFGPYEEPPKSVMEHLADFDDRLAKLERAVQAFVTTADHVNALKPPKGKKGK